MISSPLTISEKGIQAHYEVFIVGDLMIVPFNEKHKRHIRIQNTNY